MWWFFFWFVVFFRFLYNFPTIPLLSPISCCIIPECYSQSSQVCSHCSHFFLALSFSFLFLWIFSPHNIYILAFCLLLLIMSTYALPYWTISLYLFSFKIRFLCIHTLLSSFPQIYLLLNIFLSYVSIYISFLLINFITFPVRSFFHFFFLSSSP